VNIIFIIVVLLILLYLIVCLGIYFFQEKFVFIPQKDSQSPPEDMDIRVCRIKTRDGEMLHAWWMPVYTLAYTVLFFHGNAGNISRGEKRMRLFQEMGFNALAVDYRGYGESSGKIRKEEDIYEDARASYEYLQNTLEIDEDKIIIWGWSLGGAVAIDLAQHKPCLALVMESTFYSLKEMAKRTFWFMPSRLTMKYHFLSGEKMSQVDCPILFVHSRQDETVPYAQGEKLFAKYNGKKKFIEIEGDHNHGIFESQEKFMAEALPFLQENL
jgi:uncharacterized protein